MMICSYPSTLSIIDIVDLTAMGRKMVLVTEEARLGAPIARVYQPMQVEIAFQRRQMRSFEERGKRKDS
jgi:hypothetical protein